MKATADAGRVMGSALPKPRSPIRLETKIFPALQRSLQEINAFQDFLHGLKWLTVKRNLFISVGAVSRALTMTFL